MLRSQPTARVRGFTLLEILVGLAIGSISIIAAAHVARSAVRSSGRGAQVGTGLQESQLTPLLELARAKTDANQQRLIWYTPTEYCNFDPMTLDLGVKGCTAALYNMCVEPDGAVRTLKETIYEYKQGKLVKK